MASSSRKQSSRAFPAAAIVTMVVATAGAVVVNGSFVQYPLLAVAVGSALFFLSTALGRENDAILAASRSPRRRKLLDIAILASITATVFLGATARGHVPDLVYPLTAFTAAGIAVRVLVAERLYLPALQAGLLALSFRTTIWDAFPVYGQDTLLHLGITGYIASAGEIPAFIDSYYRNYLGAHMLGAITELITGVPTKTAFFLSIGLAHVLTLGFVYLLLVELFDRRRIALLVALTVALSGGHLHLGTELYAQTLANALLPAFLYLFLVADDLRTLALLLLFGATVVVTHNLLPIVLVGTGVTLLVCGWVSKQFEESDSARRYTLKPLPVGAALSVIAIGTFYYWRVTDYLSYQVNRVKSILSIGSLSGAEEVSRGTEKNLSENTGTSGHSDTQQPDSSTPSDQPDPDGVWEVEPSGALDPVDVSELGGIPTVSIFDVTLPNVLSWAAPYLFLGIVATIAAFFVGREMLERRAVPNSWVIAAMVLFGGFSIAFASGNLGAVGRADATVSVLTAPLLAYVYSHLTGRSRAIVGKGIVVTLVAICVLAGTLSAPVAMPERTETSFEPLATSQEVASVDFAQRYTTNTSTDVYLEMAASHSQLRRGNHPENAISSLFDHTRIQASRQNYEAYLENPDHSLLYRPYFGAFFGVSPPSSMNKVYSAGNTSVYTGWT